MTDISTPPAMISPVSLVTERLVGPPRWPSLKWCAGLALAGYLLALPTGVVFSALIMLSMASMLVPDVWQLKSWLACLYLLAVPPLVAAYTVNLAEGGQGAETLEVLKLTNLPHRAIYSGYARAAVYRLRLLLVGVVAVLPLTIDTVGAVRHIVLGIGTMGFAFLGAMIGIVLTVRLGTERRTAMLAASSVLLLHLAAMALVIAAPEPDYGPLALLVMAIPFLLTYLLPRIPLLAP